MTTIINKTDLTRKALVLPLAGTRGHPNVVIPISDQDLKGAEILARELLSKYGYNLAQIDAILTKAENEMLERRRVWAARCELRRKVEGNGRWKKVNGHWVLKDRYRPE